MSNTHLRVLSLTLNLVGVKNMSAKTNFKRRMADIDERAGAMLHLCVHSQFDPDTSQMLNDEQRISMIPQFVADGDHAMFESMEPEHQQLVVSGMQSAVRDYEETYGEFPRAEILASAHKAMENMLLLEGRDPKGSRGAMMLESLGESMNESDGVEIRARMVGIVLPVLLGTPTIDAATTIPASHDEVEIFKVYRLTGTAFGDFAKGVEIDQLSVGQYSSMRQRFPMVKAQQPDGANATHTFTSKTDLENTSVEIPFNKGSVSLFVNRKAVCRDLDSGIPGKMSGVVMVPGATESDPATEVIVNCDIDYTLGTIVATPASTLPTGMTIDVQFEVDIEKQPELIPVVDYEMEGKKIRPFQRAIAADATIQTMFTMQREYGIDYKSMQQSHLRNIVASEKAQGHLRDMNYACLRETEFNVYVTPGEDWRVHRQRLQEVLLNVSEAILESTKVVGMTGLYAGRSASTILKTLGAPDFVAVANYRQTNDIHYAGRLFGVWKVFEAPIVIGDWEMLCYGRGPNHNEAGYVVGDAIPATLYTHPILANLRARDTLYELTYGEIHPYDGENYFYRVRLLDEAPAEAEAEATP